MFILDPKKISDVIDIKVRRHQGTWPPEKPETVIRVTQLKKVQAPSVLMTENTKLIGKMQTNRPVAAVKITESPCLTVRTQRNIAKNTAVDCKAEYKKLPAGSQSADA